MINAIDRLILEHGDMPEGRCLAGFSGGADSTALICLLAEAAKSGSVFPEAVHVNHGLRGTESDGDEDFCRNFCGELGIPFHCIHADLNGKTDENACRTARFGAFRTVLTKTGIGQLVLAHNSNDAAETFLMRLLRGAGTEGLACMSSRDRRDGFTILRPLLNTGREEIRSALQKAGIPWREDSLNSSSIYLRNRIRNRLIPMMEELSAGATARIANTAAILTRENDALQQQADGFLRIHSKNGWLDTESLKTIPESMHGRILRTWWRDNSPMPEEHALNAAQTAAMIRIASGKQGKVNLPGGLHAVKCRNGLYLTGPRTAGTGNEIPYKPEEIRFGQAVLRTVPSQGNPGDGIFCQEAPADFFHGCVIRNRRPGDRIRPFGMNGSKKLQDYLTDRGIDEPWRDLIPLLCRGEEVVMAAGVGTGAVPRWQTDADNVRIVWSGEIPWAKKEREGKPYEPEL